MTHPAITGTLSLPSSGVHVTLEQVQEKGMRVTLEAVETGPSVRATLPLEGRLHLYFRPLGMQQYVQLDLKEEDQKKLDAMYASMKSLLEEKYPEVRGSSNLVIDDTNYLATYTKNGRSESLDLLQFAEQMKEWRAFVKEKLGLRSESERPDYRDSHSGNINGPTPFHRADHLLSLPNDLASFKKYVLPTLLEEGQNVEDLMQIHERLDTVDAFLEEAKKAANRAHEKLLVEELQAIDRFALFLALSFPQAQRICDVAARAFSKIQVPQKGLFGLWGLRKESLLNKNELLSSQEKEYVADLGAVLLEDRKEQVLFAQRENVAVRKTSLYQQLIGMILHPDRYDEYASYGPMQNFIRHCSDADKQTLRQIIASERRSHLP